MSDELKKGDPEFARRMKEEQVRQLRRAMAIKARALSIFEEMLKLPAFIEWMKENIIIRDEVDEANKTIVTYVIYKGDMKEEEKEDDSKKPGTEDAS